MKYELVGRHYRVTVASWDDLKAASKVEEFACEYKSIVFAVEGKRLSQMTVDSKLDHGISREGGAANKLATICSTGGGPDHKDGERRDVLSKLFKNGVEVTIAIWLP